MGESQAPPSARGRCVHYRIHPELFEFLVELSENNVRAWWEPNKARYERVVRGPALDFIRAVGEGLPSPPHHTAVAAAGRLDDGPSGTRGWARTRHRTRPTPGSSFATLPARRPRPGFYVHISATNVSSGPGWRPDSPPRGHWARIATEGDVWDVWGGAAFREHSPGGDSLKRALGYAKDHPRLEDIKRKDYIVLQELDIDDILDIGLPRMCSSPSTASPHVRFLTRP